MPNKSKKSEKKKQANLVVSLPFDDLVCSRVSRTTGAQSLMKWHTGAADVTIFVIVCELLNISTVINLLVRRTNWFQKGLLDQFGKEIKF